MNKKSTKTIPPKNNKVTDKSVEDNSTEKFLYKAVKTLKTEDRSSRVIDLSASGPVRLIKTAKGRGLLVHHACGDNSITLVSLTTGEGFSLSKDAARDLAGILSEWSGPETSTISQWVAEGDTWTLAE